MITLAQLVVANEQRWPKASILPSRLAETQAVAKSLCAPNAVSIYQQISVRTLVPWFIIAVIHEREADQNWGANIAQGDPWNKISRHVPKGRGPFSSFQLAAFDALVNCPPYAHRWKDWSVGGSLTLLEQYNGLGYEDYHNEDSPYIWGATTEEQRGKYIGDNQFDPSAWDSQLGCAAMLKAMQQLDSGVAFQGVKSVT